jgi:hypothetical protein
MTYVVVEAKLEYDDIYDSYSTSISFEGVYGPFETEEQAQGFIFCLPEDPSNFEILELEKPLDDLPKPIWTKADYWTKSYGDWTKHTGVFFRQINKIDVVDFSKYERYGVSFAVYTEIDKRPSQKVDQQIDDFLAPIIAREAEQKALILAIEQANKDEIIALRQSMHFLAHYHFVLENGELRYSGKRKPRMDYIHPEKIKITKDGQMRYTSLPPNKGLQAFTVLTESPGYGRVKDEQIMSELLMQVRACIDANQDCF